jgi:large conductance mechanosensitive channel
MLDRGQQYAQRGFKGTISTLGDFRKFVLRGNVVDLAVGVAIGAAFNTVVQGLVKDLIDPLIAIFGAPSLNTVKYTGAPFSPTNPWLYGDFLSLLISFLITAAVIYFFVVKPVNTLMALHKRDEPAPTTKECPFCTSLIPVRAVRCPECTSQLPPEQAVATNAAGV